MPERPMKHIVVDEQGRVIVNGYVVGESESDDIRRRLADERQQEQEVKRAQPKPEKK